MIEVQCFSCQNKWSVTDRVGIRDECPKCGQDAHVCKNCRFYDAKAYNECREPAAEVVREKERANFCDHFEPGGERNSETRIKDLKSAAEALFKKS